MSKTVVIAEKPSVAADLTRALGGKPGRGRVDFFEVNDFFITSAVGHLAELSLPTSGQKKKGIPWGLTHLPIIPEHFELKPIARSEDRLKVIKKLLHRKEVDAVINACDAGREGELIFNNIIEITGIKKPVRRLWLQSMTPEAIREGFTQLRDQEQMQPLADAALCRAQSDWLVGINSTRALTAINSGGGGFQLTPVGRVQTPTLAILAEREKKIRHFQPQPYWEVYGEFQVEAGRYQGRWFNPSFKKAETSVSSAHLKSLDQLDQLRAERLWQKEEAEAIFARALGQPGDIEEQKKSTTQSAPLLYDLTTLQREANSRFGLSAKRTLQIAQRLYEHHKVLTYPRTDSRYLPEDNLAGVKRTLGSLSDPNLKKHAAHALEQGWVVKTGKVFNNKKISDHHAIIPTGTTTDKLDEMEFKLYQMVVQRLIAIFYPVARFDQTTRITRVGEDHFKSEGKILTDPGWLAVYGKSLENVSADKMLVPVKVEKADAKAKVLEQAATKSLEIKEAATRPPARFSEATLLSAMEGAGKLIEDEELRNAMSQRGLGTPATRAAIIEGLLLDAYVLREGRELIVTSKGMALVELLRHMGVAALTSAEMTGTWEFQLKEMELGKKDRDSFMQEIRTFTQDIVEKVKKFEHQSSEEEAHPFPSACPQCGAPALKETIRKIECPQCQWSLWKSLASRPFETEELRELIEKKRVGPLDGFRSRFGKTFGAIVELDEKFKTKFCFDDQQQDSLTQEALRQAPIIVECPACHQGMIREGANAYICDASLNGKNDCHFRTGKVILQQPISQEQMVKLATTGKTDLLKGFVSKKGRRFSAYLKVEKDKVGFEFEPSKKAASSPRKLTTTKAAAKGKSKKG